MTRHFLCLAALMACAHVHAQEWPAKPVRLIVPFGAGGTTDILSRVLGERRPRSLKIATLLSKPARRVVDIPVQWIGFEIPDRFVVGYGLDFDEQYRNLRYVGVLATGYNVVDVRAARARGVVVSNAPGYGTRSVAQHAFALVLELANRAGHHAATVAAGRWATCPDYCYWDHPLTELEGRVMGIVGFGRIGRATAELALAFGMKVVVNTPRPPEIGRAHV